MNFEDLEEKQMYLIDSDNQFVGIYFVKEIERQTAKIVFYDHLNKETLSILLPKSEFNSDYFVDSIKMTRVHASKLSKEIREIIKELFGNRVNEDFPYDMGDEIDTPQNVTRKNRFSKLLDAIKNNDTLAMTYIVNEFPRLEIGTTLDKLKKRKSKYRKYPGYDVAISKLEWRRSH
jgi:hypothetical protein